MISDYLTLGDEAQARADAIRAARESSDETGTVVAWESPQALRHWAHEQETAQECHRLMFAGGAMRAAAMRRAWQHAQHCAARQEAAHKPWCDLVPMTLAQVASDDTRTVLRDDSSPPGKSAHRSPLATCAASNAPGLTVHHRRTAT